MSDSTTDPKLGSLKVLEDTKGCGCFKMERGRPTLLVTVDCKEMNLSRRLHVSADEVVGRAIFTGDFAGAQFQYCVMFNGKRLRNDSTFRDNSVPNEAVLELVEWTWMILLQTMAGTLIPLQCDPDGPIERVQELVQDKTGIPVHEQRFVYKGRTLSDINLTLSDYGVKNGALVHLCLRLRG